MKLIGFDLGNAAAHRMDGWYRWVLLVLVPVKPSRIDFDPLVDFTALVTRFSSVIAAPLTLRLDFMHTIQR
jgi:hypothetical protein